MGLECLIWKPFCIGYAAQAVACDAGFAVRGLGPFGATDSRYTLRVPNIRVSFLDAENCAPKRWVEYDHLGLGMQKLGKECGANCCMLEAPNRRRQGHFDVCREDAKHWLASTTIPTGTDRKH